jgi:glycosyltransferase involved in cell wall biosynthesis
MTSLPLVSVVLPVRNERMHIRRCLDAVLRQDYPPDRLEVIVADGLSTDGTREAAGSFSDSHPSLRVISNAGKIVPAGLNAAIAAAHGDVVVRVDGHCEIASNYVSECVRHLQSGADAVGGPIETIGETAVARAIAAGMSSRFGVGDSAFRTTTGQTRFVDTVAFPAYPRAVLDRIGPFDEELVRNQDDEYNYRLRKHGGRVLLAASVRSRYFSRSSFASLWRQYFQYGYWKVRVLQKHPRQMRARQFVPALFVLALAASLGAALLSVAPWWAFVSVAGMYIALNLAASVSASGGHAATALLLPIVFVVLHVSYGCGFLKGLVAFSNRWRGTTPSAHHHVPDAGPFFS